MANSGYQLADRKTQLSQALKRLLGRLVMDENAASLLPEMAELQEVVYEDVSRILQELALFAGAAGDDFDAGEVARRPIHLLSLGPAAHGAAGQDNGIKMGDGIEQAHGVGHKREMTVKVFVVSDPAPKRLGPKCRFRLPRPHVEQALSRRIEVGEHAIAVKK